MTDPKTSKLTGEILSIEKGWEPSSYYWFDVTIKMTDGHMVNSRYIFRRESVRNNLYNSLQKGMTVTISVDGLVNLERKIDYEGVGAIRIHDHAAELEMYISAGFRQEAKEFFTDSEVLLIRDLLERAKQEIKEEFDPSPDELEKINEHIESLSKKTESVTKYEWKHLFVSCVVSVSVDLGFGSTIPEALYNLFKKLIMELIEYRLPYKTR